MTTATPFEHRPYDMELAEMSEVLSKVSQGVLELAIILLWYTLKPVQELMQLPGELSTKSYNENHIVPSVERATPTG